MNAYDILREPLTTEKTYGLREEGKYAFIVHPRANKVEVKRAVESLFEVDVVSVNIINLPAKRRRAGRRWIESAPAKKKAIVRLAPGQSIRALESVG